MLQKRPVSVLIAPLDWGLGHATRCIPIIREFVRQGARVSIASSGAQRILLEKEFRDLEFFDLPGYEIHYRKGPFLKWGLLFKMPVILRRIRIEKRWLEDFLKTHQIDLLVSDNRYGLNHQGLRTVFITHQLSIRTGLGSFFDKLLLRWNYRLIQQFSVCWVPDWLGSPSLAGELSHPQRKPRLPTQYIGILSRIKPVPAKITINPLLILLSGPEPQRSQLENIIFSQLAGLTISCIVLRGLPDSSRPAPYIRDGVQVFNHLASAELNQWLRSSDIILTRSGYSSIMDMVQLRKNAILVPTPGQTEQEYLGKHLHELKWMFTVPQRKFNLVKAIKEYKEAALTIPELPQPVLDKVVGELLTDLENKRQF